ncbi:MAG TPA: sugar phosphate isomerase/epimerase family protein [Bryobacteraceae bacterium]|jgi:sugar phosphate isomerase/epimerase|nr:sugar phosphate isomerase/epimerase family protein [Bryobacteraceae bacterium]
MSLLPEALSRRQFFQTSAALAGATTLRGAEPHLDFPSNPRDRLSLTSWPFRRIMETPGNSDRDRSKPGIDAKDFASMAVERFGIHNINPLTSHFRSTDPGYLEELRNAVAKAGSHIVDLGHGGRPFYHPDKVKRQAAIEFGKKGVDIALAIGSPSVRQHINGAPGVKPNVDLTAETLGEVAAYGEKKNIVVNLENDAAVSENPFFLVAVIEKVGSPYLRALPDFANSMNLGGGAEENYKAVTAMFRHVFNMAHVKDAYADDKGQVRSVDLDRLFGIAKQAGYRGYFSIEAELPGDPFANTAKVTGETLKYLS